MPPVQIAPLTQSLPLEQVPSLETTPASKLPIPLIPQRAVNSAAGVNAKADSLTAEMFATLTVAVAFEVRLLKVKGVREISGRVALTTLLVKLPKRITAGLVRLTGIDRTVVDALLLLLALLLGNTNGREISGLPMVGGVGEAAIGSSGI